METTCPKCQHRQPPGDECLRCGLIFSRYRPEFGPPAGEPSEEPREGGKLGWFRVVRWTVLAAALAAVGLAFWRAEPPVVEADAQAAEHVEVKMREAEKALRAGRPAALRLNEAEVNHWLGKNLDVAANAPPDVEEMIGREASGDEISHAVQDVRMKLVGDQVQAYVAFDFHGKSMSLSVNGRVRTEDGYLRFEPTSGWLGSLPIPRAALSRAVDNAFSSPENREKLRLPEYVRDLAVEGGQFVVRYR